MALATWRARPAAGAQERGSALARTGAVRALRNRWAREIDAVVASATTGAAPYAVAVRWGADAGGPLCVCSCPDARPGYCKHAAAVLEHVRPNQQRPSWLASAYKTDGDDAGDDDEADAADAAGRWITHFRAHEAWLAQRDAEALRELLSTAVKRDGQSLRVVSQMLGGSDASAESYQTMTATRLFDTRHLIEEASAPRMRWIVLYMLMDSPVPWMQKYARNVAGLPQPEGEEAAAVVDLASETVPDLADRAASAGADAGPPAPPSADRREDPAAEERAPKRLKTQQEDEAASGASSEEDAFEGGYSVDDFT